MSWFFLLRLYEIKVFFMAKSTLIAIAESQCTSGSFNLKQRFKLKLLCYYDVEKSEKATKPPLTEFPQMKGSLQVRFYYAFEENLFHSEKN